jgi:hypothetical protein
MTSRPGENLSDVTDVCDSVLSPREADRVALRNLLLATIPAIECQPLLSEIEYVSMALGEVLYESGGRLTHVHFPATCIVSLLYVMADGASAEVAIVGREGVVGLALVMGGDTTPSRAVVQSAGHAYRLPAAVL